MNRWLAATIAIAIGIVVGGVIMLSVAAAIGSLMWVFVFGDDSWPAWVDPAFAIGMPLLWLGSAAGLAWIVWLKLGVRRPAR
jgi:hypothetical protein